MSLFRRDGYIKMDETAQIIGWIPYFRISEGKLIYNEKNKLTGWIPKYEHHLLGKYIKDKNNKITSWIPYN